MGGMIDVIVGDVMLIAIEWGAFAYCVYKLWKIVYGRKRK